MKLQITVFIFKSVCCNLDNSKLNLKNVFFLKVNFKLFMFDQALPGTISAANLSDDVF